MNKHTKSTYQLFQDKQSINVSILDNVTQAENMQFPHKDVKAMFIHFLWHLSSSDEEQPEMISSKISSLTARKYYFRN